MNKLTLVVMVSLCTLLIACNKEEIAIESTSPREFPTKSLNSLTVTYVTEEGQDTTLSCTKVELDYYNSESAKLKFVFQNDTSLNVNGDSIEILTIASNSLLVTPTNEEQFSAEDITVTVCGEELCYSDSKDNISGTAVGFIIDDEPAGL